MRQRRNRIAGLLLSRATEGLDAEAVRELDALLAERPEPDLYRYERPAAWVFLAACGSAEERLPERLGDKLRAQADAAFRGAREPGNI